MYQRKQSDDANDDDDDESKMLIHMLFLLSDLFQIKKFLFFKIRIKNVYFRFRWFFFFFAIIIFFNLFIFLNFIFILNYQIHNFSNLNRTTAKKKRAM